MDRVDREVMDALCRMHFGAFCHGAFEALNSVSLTPNWHIDAICYRLQGMATGTHPNRLVINLPPRTLKSLIVSIMLPAWLLGRDPTRRIICASYGEELAFRFSRDCRALMETAFYRRVFGGSRLNPRKSTERELETTARGFRFATSVGGTLTGVGGDALIIDDPVKAHEVNFKAALKSANEWFKNTALSRLDHAATGLIIVTMQRIHVDDLAGVLIENDWPALVIPAIAPEPASYPVGPNEMHNRCTGDILQPDWESREEFDLKRKSIESRVFSAQYQQEPVPAEGFLIKADWLRRYDGSPEISSFPQIVLSCDPAGKEGAQNDYTAIAICGIREKEVHLLHMARGHWTVLQMRDRICSLAAEWQANQILIEDTSTGMGLIQIMREHAHLNVIGRNPKGDKESRMLRHLGSVESGKIVLPRQASWLADFESELLAFPNGRYDDQVDALLLLLDWLWQFRVKPRVSLFGPIIVRG